MPCNARAALSVTGLVPQGTDNTPEIVFTPGFRLKVAGVIFPTFGEIVRTPGSFVLSVTFIVIGY